MSFAAGRAELEPAFRKLSAIQYQLEQARLARDGYRSSIGPGDLPHGTQCATMCPRPEPRQIRLSVAWANQGLPRPPDFGTPVLILGVP